jgi:hypothetical protein
MNKNGNIAKGFSLYQTSAYVIAGLTLASVSLHPRVTCETSGSIAGLSTLALLATSLLGVLTPKDRSHRNLPAILSLVGMLGHFLFAH